MEGWGAVSLQGVAGLQRVPTLTVADVSEEKALAVSSGAWTFCPTALQHKAFRVQNQDRPFQSFPDCECQAPILPHSLRTWDHGETYKPLPIV